MIRLVRLPMQVTWPLLWFSWQSLSLRMEFIISRVERRVAGLSLLRPYLAFALGFQIALFRLRSAPFPPRNSRRRLSGRLIRCSMVVNWSSELEFAVEVGGGH